MKKICLYFQLHLPLRLRRYRFFDIGRTHLYLDDAENAATLRRTAERCYKPMNALLLKLARRGDVKISFSMSGLAVEQMREFVPEVLEGFKELAATGAVEFLGETYGQSLASLLHEEEFADQVRAHGDLMEHTFGRRPTALRNTELIYSDRIGQLVAGLGFRTMMAEGARHVLGWKSPNLVYASAGDQRLKLLLRNYKLSDSIALRFAGGGTTADGFARALAETEGEVVNLGMDYETFGEHQREGSGIFAFMEHLPAAVRRGGMEFCTASEVVSELQPVGGILSSPHPMSWKDEERDVTPWLGNELQDEALSKLFALRDRVRGLHSADMTHVWNLLQCSDHFYYMATKWLSNGDVRRQNPYGSSYDAFINYMNVLSDFELGVLRE